MPHYHGSLHKRKPTGGKKRPWRGKRAFEGGSEPTETTVGPTKQRFVHTFGGGLKVRLASAEFATVTDQGTGKSTKTKILRVITNPANVDYQRRRVITKGAVISTEAGEARVTSRPGQDGVINAVLQKASAKP